MGGRLVEISHTTQAVLKCLVIPHHFRGIKELTVKSNTMNISTIGKSSGNAVTFKYMGEFTVEKNCMDESKA